jgi:hypothetical protein
VRLRKGSADGGGIEVLEQAIDPAVGDMDDEADRCGDEIAGLELPVEDVPLDESTREELACEHFVTSLGDAPREESEERQVLFARLRSVLVTLCQISAFGA